MLGNRGSGFDTGCLLTKFLFFVNLVAKNSLIVKKRIASRKWQQPFTKGTSASASPRGRKSGFDF